MKPMIALLVALVMIQPALASPTPTLKPVATQPSRLLKQIPADCLAFVIINDVKGTAADVEKFLTNIGVSGFLRSQMPDGLLAAAKRQLEVGEGFTGEGSMAFVVLNPKVCGTTFEEWVSMEDGKDKMAKAPFLLFIPGKDLNSIAPNAMATADGPLLQVKAGLGSGGWALERDGYVILSPNDTTLKALLASGKTLDSVLTKKQIDFIGRNHIAAYGNVQTVRPDLVKLLKKARQEGKNNEFSSGKFNLSVSTSSAEQEAFFERLTTEILEAGNVFMLGARLEKEGVLTELAADLNPDSEVAKELKAVKPVKMFDKLPAGQYVFAAASNLPPQYAVSTLGLSTTRDGLRDLLGLIKRQAASQPTTGSAEQIEAGMKLADTVIDQYLASQYAIYYTPQGKSLFAADWVIECKDARKLQADIKNVVVSLQKHVASAPKHFAIESAGEGVDVFVLKLYGLDEEEHSSDEYVARIVGDRSIKIMMTPADDKSLVITLCGGKEFLDQAVKAARGEDTLATDRYMTQTLKHMPENLLSVTLINGGALVDTITRGLELLGGRPMPLAVTNIPVASGTGLTDNTLHQVFFVPNILIKQSVSSGAMLFVAAQGIKKPASTRPSASSQAKTNSHRKNIVSD